MIAFAWIEWNWGTPILDESWRDIVTLGGFGLTILGLMVTFVQLRKTQSAAKAARVAAERALVESRSAYQKFTVALAHRFVHECKIHVENSAWEKAAIRLSDLTDQMNQLVSLDASWSEFAGELHGWSVTCNRLRLGELKRFPESQKWLELCSRVEAKLARLLGPFATPAGEDQ